ncbi:MAG: MMPL family transporter [Deltaproteobacteria bacterium]|nr:MMPL family transporter [Deltaproteobacteria bacterium]
MRFSHIIRHARDRAEIAFEAWGHSVARRAWLTIALCGALSLALASQLPRLTVDTSEQSFLHETDPVRITQDLASRQFGRKGQVLIALEPDELFSLAFLEKLRSLHFELEAVPQVQAVTSLINARNTFGRGDELVVEDLLERWPGTPAELEDLERRVFANPLYLNHLVDEAGRITTITVELDTYSSQGAQDDAEVDFEEAEWESPTEVVDPDLLTSQEEIAAVSRLRDVLARYEGPGLRIHLTGAAAYRQAFMSIMKRDVINYMILSGVLIALMLFALFKTLAGVLLPMTVVMLSLVCVTGTMSLFGVAVTLPMQILPTFLLAVGACSVVHILVIFYRGWTASVSREDAIASALGHSGLPVAMACLTTGGGLMSFITSDLAPVGHFGIFGPIGIVYILLFTLVLVPALLQVIPMRPSTPRKRGEQLPLLDRMLLAFGFTATRFPWAVLSVSLLLAVICIGGIAQLRFSHDPISWLPEDDEFRQATEFINENLRGIYDPDLMRRIARLHAEADELELDSLRVGKVTSLADIVQETHQALNENRPEFYRIPDARGVIAQELLLFENSGSDDLEKLVDSQFSTSILTLRLPWVDGSHMNRLIDLTEERFGAVIGDTARLTLTGGTVVFARTFDAVIRSMAQSYLLALAIITPLMMLLIGSLRGGLISMVPNLFPILMTLGLMGYLGYPLDFSTVMMGAIVLGVAVDDTIHFLHVFQRYFDRSDDARRAVRETLLTTGRAITLTTIVLAIGFGSFMLSAMSNMVALGFFVSFAVTVAFFADLLIAPALLVLTRRRHSKRGEPAPITTSDDTPAGVAPGVSIRVQR